MKGSEILEVLHSCTETKAFLMSLYDCQYGEFFNHLARVEQMTKDDR